jgi:ribosome recycling factor
MSSESVPIPSTSKTNLQVQPSTIKTREDLHLLVRSYCIEHKISLKKISGDYRSAVEQSLKELLSVAELTQEHHGIVKNFCQQVPAFYRKYRSNVIDVRRHHSEFFAGVILCTADISFDEIPNVPNTE